ncbi:HNH endonuclease [Peribacillus butanolivorans]|uniref:HNH endonuclease n=1 Tax=Peribacillus butanolivorans TaxID=421767 RepID=UPI0036DD1564
MNIKMNLDEILLFLDLMEKEKKTPLLDELKMMLYYLENYDEVKKFYKKVKENGYRLPNKFLAFSLVHFIENFEECIALKEEIYQNNTKRKYSDVFIQQILLSGTKEQAKETIEEAKGYGVLLKNTWADKYDSIREIIKRQEEWKRIIKEQLIENDNFPKIYNDFSRLKHKYFDNIPLEYIKGELSNRNQSQISVYTRSVFIKEYARRISNGVCQLCDKGAPFRDKHGNPFLEVHHIQYLSEGGSDSMENVVALCPNCHRRIHHLQLEADFKKVLEKAKINLNKNGE